MHHKPNIRFYAGVGARNTPDNILQRMTSIARMMSKAGFHLRSGGATGADAAFANGTTPGNRTQYLPWPGYNNVSGRSARPLSSDELRRCEEIAASLHPAWSKCTQGARKMHARNIAIVAGPDLETHVDALLCWTPNASITGGTGQAIRAARHFSVPVFNLADDHVDEAIVRTIIRYRPFR